MTLTPRLEKALRKLPPGSLLAFDFDGTLAPLRRNPALVSLPKGLARTLRRLAPTFPIAVISGRALADLERKFAGFDLHLIGSHGFESKSPEGKTLARGKAIWRKSSRAWKRAFVRDIAAYTELQGVTIEDKTYSLTLHFREAKQPTKALEISKRIASALSPAPRLIDGLFVLNLVPAESADKGEALRELMRRLGAKHALFLGDDVTDEHVFEKRLPGVLGIRIGAAVKTAAHHRLAKRTLLATVLAQLTVGVSESRLKARVKSRKL